MRRTLKGISIKKYPSGQGKALLETYCEKNFTMD